MIIRPAIDIREGKCVQLVGGDYDNELVRLDDPLSVAKSWIEKGFNNIHIIDLDRATNRGDNRNLVYEIVELSKSDSNIDTRVGGGIRSEQDVTELIDAGANSVAIGTKAITDKAWFESMESIFPGKITVAVEVDEREVKIGGWQESSSETLEDLVEYFNSKNIAGLLVTAIHLEGRMAGTDLELFSYLRSLTTIPIIASGGITTIEDIYELQKRKIDEVVLGAAIYTNENFVKELQGFMKD